MTIEQCGQDCPHSPYEQNLGEALALWLSPWERIFLSPSSLWPLLSLLALPNNKVVAATEPLTCKFGPVSGGTIWSLGATVVLQCGNGAFSKDQITA